MQKMDAGIKRPRGRPSKERLLQEQVQKMQENTKADLQDRADETRQRVTGFERAKLRKKYGRWHSRGEEEDAQQGIITPYSIEELRRGGHLARQEYKKIMIRQRAAAAFDLHKSYLQKLRHARIKHKIAEPTHEPEPKFMKDADRDCFECERIRLLRQSSITLLGQHRTLLRKIGEWKPQIPRKTKPEEKANETEHKTESDEQ